MKIRGWIAFRWERFLNNIRWQGYPAPGPFFWQNPPALDTSLSPEVQELYDLAKRADELGYDLVRKKKFPNALEMGPID